jgi:hypothetical protein
MHVQTKFLRLREPVSLGDRIDNWRVCWIDGWLQAIVETLGEVQLTQPIPDLI